VGARFLLAFSYTRDQLSELIYKFLHELAQKEVIIKKLLTLKHTASTSGFMK
jgi:hypothetical protein